MKLASGATCGSACPPRSSLLMVAILVLTMAGGFFVVQWNLSGQLNDQFEHRALSIAQTPGGRAERGRSRRSTRATPAGSAQMAGPALATRPGQTGALFVVITNARGIGSPTRTRPHRHPDHVPRTREPDTPSRSAPARPGWASSAARSAGSRRARRRCSATAGWSARSRSASRPPRSAGRCPRRCRRWHRSTCSACSRVGVLAALALARRLKRQTFGLELGEIAALLQEREAMLHGIREGGARLRHRRAGSCWPTTRPRPARPARRSSPAASSATCCRRPARRRGDRRGRPAATCSCCTTTGCCRQPDADQARTTSSSAGWSPSRTAPSPRRSSGRWTR